MIPADRAVWLRTPKSRDTGAVEAVILGAVAGIGGGMLRDILLREVPIVLRERLYAVPALLGAAVVVGASEAGTHMLAVPMVGAAVCFAIRLAGIHWDVNLLAARSRSSDR